MAYRQDPTTLALPSSQQAEVVEVIQRTGLDSNEFRWAVQPSRYHLGRLVSVLVHAPTDAYFRFEFLESALGQNRVSVFMPGEDPRGARKAAASWGQQLGHVREWLARLTDARK